MSTISVGKVRTIWLGTWSSATAYTPLDAVTYLGSSYVALLASTNVIPSASTSATWQLAAEKGVDGTNGTNGTTAVYSMSGSVLTITS